MSGIILLAVLALWFFITKKLSDFFTSAVQSEKKKRLLYPLVFTLVFIAPVADEIIGGFQFRALCTPENLLIYDADKVKGKALETKESTTQTINKIIPIWELTRKWFDPDTKEVLITRRMYEATGGWLSRLIGYPQGSPPYTFNGKCSSKEYYEMFDKLNITKIEN